MTWTHFWQDVFFFMTQKKAHSINCFGKMRISEYDIFAGRWIFFVRFYRIYLDNCIVHGRHDERWRHKYEEIILQREKKIYHANRFDKAAVIITTIIEINRPFDTFLLWAHAHTYEHIQQRYRYCFNMRGKPHTHTHFSG